MCKMKSLIAEVTKASAAERERNAVQNKVQEDDTTSKLLTPVESLIELLAVLKQVFGDLKRVV